MVSVFLTASLTQKHFKEVELRDINHLFQFFCFLQQCADLRAAGWLRIRCFNDNTQYSPDRMRTGLQRRASGSEVSRSSASQRPPRPWRCQWCHPLDASTPVLRGCLTENVLIYLDSMTVSYSALVITSWSINHQSSTTVLDTWYEVFMLSLTRLCTLACSPCCCLF